MTEKTTTSSPANFKRKTAFTVFFRYSPADTSITRKHFESFFSDVGPVKKCSLIRQNKDKAGESKQREARGYGFCKFTCEEDSVSAAKTLNESYLNLEYGQRTKVWVELADTNVADKKKDQLKSKLHNQKKKVNAKPRAQAEENNKAKAGGDAHDDVDESNDNSNKEDLAMQQLQAKKRTSRVILRNLSFYATEHNIRQVMEEKFGEVLDIHLPLVPVPASTNNDDNNYKKKRPRQQQHRGFAFVTFANPRSAHKAVEACASEDGEVLVKKRPVAIDFSVSKFQHKRMKEEDKGNKHDDEDAEAEDSGSESGSDSDSGSESGSESGSGSDSGSEDDSESESDSDEDSDSNSDDDDTDAAKPTIEKSHQHSLFLRNLPFDATRHDLFTLFAQYGHIAGIFLVKDRSTGIGKGTAFVRFSKEGGCMRALEASNGGTIDDKKNAFQSGKNLGGEAGHSGEGIYLGGRKIFVDLAVDKNTADSLKVERDEEGKPINRNIGKDKRNLYLKGEGRVESTPEGQESNDPDAWENIPESDQMKRGRAHQDRSTKLRSPLFFINPFRLSIRNLAKHVEESQLKALMVEGIKNGLERGLVTKDDIITHWRAGGEMDKRDILEKVALSEKEEGGLIPAFDENKIKRFIPSVFIDRDFQVPMRQADQSKGSRLVAPSRGFGFVEFTHHAHALACLRELNNNTTYSAEFVSGGKRALELKAQRTNKKKKKQKKLLKNIDVEDGPDGKSFVGEDGSVRIPRLVIEFTVENKAKARQQAERKAAQQANLTKQRLAAREKNGEATEAKSKSGGGETKKKKKGRGAQQREKKRRMREQGLLDADGKKKKTGDDDDNTAANKKRRTDPSNNDATSDAKSQTKKGVKPPKKKKKIDKDEKKFEDMVRSYKKAFSSTRTSNVDGDAVMKEAENPRATVEKKRWFDE